MKTFKIKYIVTSEFESADIKEYLKWWSDHTKIEQRMLDRSVAFFRKNLLFAVFAFHGEKLIGAAGVIPCLDRHGKKMQCIHDALVVELVSNFIDPDYRDRHIGRELVLQRLKFIKENNYFPVSVTGSIIMQKIFSDIAVTMDTFPKYNHIRKEVRVCECDNKPCGICPLKDKAIWVFPRFLKKFD
jgi:GNAT superfamily N-acetyltransferase